MSYRFKEELKQKYPNAIITYDVGVFSTKYYITKKYTIDELLNLIESLRLGADHFQPNYYLGVFPKDICRIITQLLIQEWPDITYHYQMIETRSHFRRLMHEANLPADYSNYEPKHKRRGSRSSKRSHRHSRHIADRFYKI